MSKVGIYSANPVNEIFPSGPNDLRTSWAVIMPLMHDEGDCIQIGGKYILSIGAHATHQNLLLSAKYKVTYLELLEIANLISYIFDTICYIGYPDDKKESKKFLKNLKSYFNIIGRTISELVDDEDRISDIYEVSIEVVGDAYLRKLPYRFKTRYCSCEIPKNIKIKRAFSVYRQALLSIEPQGMILNYWRVLEAITTKAERYHLISNFLSKKLKPVKCFLPPTRAKAFNLITKYRRVVKNYFKNLLRTHNTPEAILDHLYKNRRNPSAHANTNILEVSNDVSLVSLYRDALLLKYLSRCAIEEYWCKL